MSALVEFSPVHRIVKRNVVCPYCGRPFSAELRSEQEHVVGRRFVPKGTLARSWNLILQSCGGCNDEKAELENDISAITMQPDAAGRYASNDPRLAAEAGRKARTTSRRTGRFVSEREQPLEFKVPFGDAMFSFSFEAPAQADEKRLFRLAQMQLAAFFLMLTYKEDEQRGYWWLGEFAPVVAVRKADWGNERLRWIEEISAGWEYRLHAITADTFYKIWIRRRPGDPAVWAWAMEWNHTFRIAGFVGEPPGLTALLTDLPKLKVEEIAHSRDDYIRWREEIPLADDADRLFDRPADSSWDIEPAPASEGREASSQ